MRFIYCDCCIYLEERAQDELKHIYWSSMISDVTFHIYEVQPNRHISRFLYIQLRHNFYISNYVIMSAMVSQIISLTIVHPTVYTAQIKENIKAPLHWPLCGEFTGNRRIPPTKGLVTRKLSPLDDIIMHMIGAVPRRWTWRIWVKQFSFQRSYTRIFLRIYHTYKYHAKYGIFAILMWYE